MQWTDGYAPRFLAFFVAWSFFCSQAESTPAPAPVSREDHTERAANRWLASAGLEFSLFYLDEIECMF